MYPEKINLTHPAHSLLTHIHARELLQFNLKDFMRNGLHNIGKDQGISIQMIISHGGSNAMTHRQSLDMGGGGNLENISLHGFDLQMDSTWSKTGPKDACSACVGGTGVGLPERNS